MSASSIFLILLDFVVGLPLAQTVHEFSRINEWKDLHSGIRGLIRGWLTAKPQIPLEPGFSKWPLGEPTLADLLERSTASSPEEWNRYILLDGAEAQRVYEAIGRYSIHLGYFYEEIDGVRKNYYILLHPLLPYEAPEPENYWLIGNFRAAPPGVGRDNYLAPPERQICRYVTANPREPNYYLAQIPAPGIEKPNFTLTCYPSDGTLPLPTLSNP